MTVTLPTVLGARGAVVGVFCGGAATATTVKTNGGYIYGDFVSAASEVKLTQYQHVLLQSDGSNWLIIAGEPKREQAYVATEAEEAEPSATRPAFVSLLCRATAGKKPSSLLEVGPAGSLKKADWFVLGSAPAEETGYGLRALVLPGQKWKVILGTGNSVYQVTTLPRVPRARSPVAPRHLIWYFRERRSPSVVIAV